VNAETLSIRVLVLYPFLIHPQLPNSLKVTEQILKAKKHVRTDVRMNYINYESSIVEKFGIALIGWPVNGKVQNPGDLGPDEGLVLRNALERMECKWIILTEKEQEARKIQNAQREKDGEQIYAPQKKRPKKSTARDNGVDLENGNNDNGMMLHSG